MRPIFLIGYMCSGKTTLGRALSVYTGMRFIDLDEAIEQRAGMTVREIFATQGEQAFRDLEARMLNEVSTLTDVIIACGGGTPCRPGAMETMNAAGLTVWLVPNQSVLIQRLLDGKAHRPLISHIDTPEEMSAFVDRAMASREVSYAQATAIFDTSQLETPAQIDAAVKSFEKRFLN